MVMSQTWRLATDPRAALRRGARRLRTHGLGSHLLGLVLRRHFHSAGIILVRGGWPLPRVENRGGSLEIGNCALFSGVRLECWEGATLRIGSGTYLNRNTEIVAARSVTLGRDCKVARDVIIMDTDQHALPGEELVVAPVCIEDRVWIGARAIVVSRPTFQTGTPSMAPNQGWRFWLVLSTRVSIPWRRRNPTARSRTTFSMPPGIGQ